ncbi:MAG: 23S rRNA (uracil(1939)-C(5))-methyltransferase RlmD, partial [Clostridia bacterium]|nr:23S rRNA (uracil(1939)-C(5))-methyltransferase RlmD [Clostridia bacterium]
MFHKDEILTLDITEVNNLGCGVGKSDGVVVFVKGAVSGDRVEAKIIKVAKSYLVGRLEKIVVPSPHRAKEALCDAPLACGGCVYRHMEYAHELDMKKRYVEGAFRKAGLADVTVEDVQTTGVCRGYRNKAQYPFGKVGGKIVVGFYAEKTHKVIPCTDCALQPALFGDICRFVCEFASAHAWSVYNEETGRGLLRHLYIREGKSSGEVMVCLVVNGDRLPDENEFSNALTARFACVKSLVLNRNEKNTNVVLGQNYRTLAGRGYIEDILSGKRFRIAPAAFYQVNHDGAELLYGIAAERAALREGETLLDLYCGIGTIGLSLASKNTRVVGVEIVESAVACARENAALNGMENTEFFCGDASDAERLVNEALERCGDPERTTVVVDPPRKGLDKALICYLADRQMKKIVYVSCDPDTLARDCALFRTLGYEIGAVTPVDMFPKTGHVETVCLLSKLNAKQHIEINLDLDELDLTDAEKKATYQEIKDYVREHSGLKVSSLYIAQVKQKCGIIERENYNKPKSEDAKQPGCPP